MIFTVFNERRIFDEIFYYQYPSLENKISKVDYNQSGGRIQFSHKIKMQESISQTMIKINLLKILLS
jgi:hypothetical protein